MTIEPLTMDAKGMARLIKDQLGSGYTPSTVIRELFQNADDAGATRLVIGFHPGLPKHPEALRRRPGLVVMNNGPVRPEDVDHLKQVKANQRASDPFTIGRFGIGKVALFNWADAYFLDVVAGNVQCASLITVFPELWRNFGDETSLREPIQVLESACAWVAGQPRLALWLPIRAASDPQSIIRYDEKSLPNQQWLKRETTWLPYLRMLPMLRTLKSLEIWEWDKEDIPKQLMAIDLEGKQRHPRLLEGAPAVQAFEGRIRTATKAWKYWGLEQRLPDSFSLQRDGHQISLSSLKANSEWPEDPENQTLPEPKIPHGAVVILHREDATGTETPDLTLAAFLPLGDRNLGHSASQVLFHANGFLNEQRTHFLGADGTEDQKVQAQWNKAVMCGATLPLLTQVLEKALEGLNGAGQSWVEAIAKDPQVIANPESVAHLGCFRRVFEHQKGSPSWCWRWRAVGPKERILKLPGAFAEAQAAILAPMRAAGLAIVDSLAPGIGEGKGRLALPPEILRTLTKAAEEQGCKESSSEAFQGFARLLEAFSTQLPPEERAKLPVPIRGGSMKIVSLQDAVDLHASGKLWLEDSTPLFGEWVKALEGNERAWQIAPALGHMLGVGHTPSAERLLLHLSQFVPALNPSFTDRLPLIRRMARVQESPQGRRGIRYLLHNSSANLDEEVELLIDVPFLGANGGQGALRDLMGILASESPSWTRLPEETGQVFAPEAQRWLGLIIHDGNGTLEWAIKHPEKVVTPLVANADSWNAEVLCLIVSHLRTLTKENFALWAQLPLHKDIQGKIGAMQTVDAFRYISNSPPWCPDGVQVLLPYDIQDPLYSIFFTYLDVWSNPRAVEWVLKQIEPWRHAVVLLDHLERGGGIASLPTEVRNSLDKNPWIPVNDGKHGTSLRNLVRLPEGVGRWRELLDQASGVTGTSEVVYYTDSTLAPEIRGHSAWNALIVPLLAGDPRVRANRIQKLTDVAPCEFSFGFPGMIHSQEELLIVTGLGFEDLPEDQSPRLALALLTALTAEGMTFENLEGLLQSFGKRKETAGELKSLLMGLGKSAQEAQGRWVGNEMGLGIFKQYLTTLGGVLEASAFQDLLLPNKGQKWCGATSFPDPQLLDEERDKPHFLDESWQDVILDHGFEWPVLQREQETASLLDLARYFGPWIEEGVPSAYVACFLGVLGGNHRALSLDHLKNHPNGGEKGLRDIRARLHFDGTLKMVLSRSFSGDDDQKQDYAFDRHQFKIDILGKQQPRRFSGLDGQMVELQSTQNFLVQQVVPEISIRTVLKKVIPGNLRAVALRLAAPLTRDECMSLGATTLMERIKDGTREILEKVYCNNYMGSSSDIRRGIAGEYWDQLWNKDLAHQEQLHLRSVQCLVKRNLHQTVKTLLRPIDPNEPGKRKLQDLKDAYHEAARADAEAHERRGLDPHRLANFGDAVSKAERAFVDALEDPDVERALRSGVRAYIQKRQYSPDRILFELYQNAEDAYRDWDALGESPRPAKASLEYVLIQDPRGASLNTLHWGRPICHYEGQHKQERFRDDLENMLTFNLSSKGGDNVGEHGLGFKSVHLISDHPAVVSGILAFQIRGGIYPESYHPEESLPAFLGPWAPAPPSDLGTLIHLPVRAGTTVEIEALLQAFWDSGEPLLAFSRKIQTLRWIRPDGKELTLQWKPRQLWADGDVTIEWARSTKGAHYFRIGDTDHALLLRFNEKGELELPKQAPTIWAMAPTKQVWGNQFKMMLQAPFILDQGRTRLGDADAELNQAHFLRLGQRIGSALRTWLNLPDAFNNLPIQRPAFLTELWDGFGAPLGRHLGSAGDQTAYAKALLDGINELWRLDDLCPDGFDGFISAKGVKTVMRGPSWENQDFRIAAQRHWPEAFVGCVSDARWTNGLDKYLGQEAKPTILTEAGFLLQVLGRPFEVAAYRDLSRMVAALPEPLQSSVIQGLAAAGPHFVQTMDILQGRTLSEIALVSEEAGKLWDLAPPDGQIHRGYGDPSDALLGHLRHGEVKIETLVSWCIQSWEKPSNQKFVREYLVNGKGGEPLRRRLPFQANVQSSLKAFAESLNAKFSQQFFEGSDSDDSDGEEGGQLERMDGKEALKAIHTWWMDLDEADRAPFLTQYGCGIAPQDLCSKDSEAKQVAWLKLLVLGAGHTLGRYEQNTLRAFIERGPIDAAQWLLMATNPPSLEDSMANNQWMNLLNRRLEDETGFKAEYDHLFRVLFGPMHRFAYRLDGYISIFMQQARRKAPFNLNDLAWTGGDALLTGSGLQNLPSLYQAMGYGLVFVMRELQRLKVLQNPYLERHGFVPYLATRRFLQSLAWDGASIPCVERPQLHDSRLIHALLSDALGHGEDLTFDGSFDVPLLAVAKDPDLQREVLGAVPLGAEPFDEGNVLEEDEVEILLSN